MAPSPVAPSLTSTTAPGKAFASRAELQDHYKSDWHRYNLKRRDAGLPMLNEEDFTVRYEAAVALRKEREGREERSGVDHRKDKTTKSKKSKKGQQQKKSNKRQPAFAKRNEAIAVESSEADEGSAMQEDEAADGVSNQAMEEEAPEINPSQCLFDNHISSSPVLNLKYMADKYSFFLPDADYCNDLEGLLGYCNEKVRIGNVCLYCQKMFGSAEAVLGHMRDKSHCKLAYEGGVDLDEFDVFYDYERLNADSGLGTKSPNANGETMAAVVEGDEEDGEDWEDVSDEEMSESQGDGSSMDEDDDFYDGYEREVQSSGFSITPLGELVFPDGRIVGHRGLARYYKQRFAPDRSERAAVRHAREAAGDRLHGGRVVNLNRLREDAHQQRGGGQHPGALADMGRLSGSAPAGRSGGGILVPSGGRGGFTSLSLYRYRAVVRKQRKEDARGQRLQYRTRMNTNKMDKKANRLMNGVSVAHAKR